MSTHHPPRPCFSGASWSDTTQTVDVTFTEGERYEFVFTDGADYTTFHSNFNGVYFNASVRNSAVMTYTRL